MKTPPACRIALRKNKPTNGPELIRPFLVMKPYLFKTPILIRRLFPSLLWEAPGEGDSIYLTFDDGPTPEVTPYVLDLLDRHNAKATFFCIGKNILAYPEIFNDILARGHRVGNHTFNHLNAVKVPADLYLEEVQRTESVIEELSNANRDALPRLFRPPYGRMNNTISKALRRQNYRIVMWSVLSADFDPDLNTSKSLKNLKTHSKKGSIIVFHDSFKAYKNLRLLLPDYLKYLEKERIKMKHL